MGKYIYIYMCVYLSLGLRERDAEDFGLEGFGVRSG